MASRELSILVTAKNMASRVLKDVTGDVKSMNRTISRGLGDTARNLERGVALGATAAAGAMVYAVKQAADFESALNTINTVAQVNQRELTAIGDSIRAMARSSGLALDDLTAAYYDLVSAGVAAKDAQAVLNEAVTLGIGGLGTTAETVDLLTTAMNSYGLDVQGVAEATDMFAQSIGAGKVTAAELAASFAGVGPQAAAMGIGIDELAAGYAQLTAKGEPAAGAATAMAAAMLALQRTTGPMEKLQKDLNISFAEMAGREGLAATWQLIAAEAKKAGLPLIEYTGRAEALAYVLNVSGKNAAGYAENLERVNEAHANDVATDQMLERQKGLNFQIDRLKANLRDAAITVGTEVLPSFVKLAEQATGWITEHQSEIKQFGKDLAGGVKEAVSWLGSLNWDQIGNAFKTAGQFGQTLLNAFLAMPPWVQTAVLTGWGLNKLTGGMIGSLIGELGKGLIKRVLGINAGVVNVRGAVVNAPGGGPVGGVGGKGGGRLAGAGRLAFGLTGVGAAAMIANEFGDDAARAGAGLHGSSPLGLAGTPLSGMSPKDLQWPFGPKNTPTILPDIFGGNGLLGGSTGKQPSGSQKTGPVPVTDAASAQHDRLMLTHAMTQRAMQHRENTLAASALAADQGMLNSVRNQSGLLSQIRDKRTVFNPHVNVTANINNVVSLSTGQVLQRINSYRQSLNAGTSTAGFI